MGSKYSLPEKIDQETFKYVTGEYYSDKLWNDYSSHGFIPRKKFLCMEKVHRALLECPTASDIYEGGRYYGEKHGYGLYVYPNGDIYDGEWLANERHGWGKFFDMTNGHITSGIWVRGVLNGPGKFEGSSGPIIPNHGKLVPSQGDVYEGGFKDNRYHGFGKCVFSKIFGKHRGEVYEGEWVEGVRHGHGVCTYANRNVYEGEWKNGVRCGCGILTFSNGDMYTGFFLNNVMHGRGSFTPSGCPAEEGEWMHGDRIVVHEEEESDEDSTEKFDFDSDA